LWNQQIRTDRTIPNNKPDIIIRNKNGTCLLIEGNVIKNEAENILKYKDLLIEIQRMWKVQAKIIPEGQQELSPGRSENIWPTSRANTTSGNFRRPPFWELHTSFERLK
jgi:hypothetical protein